MVAPSGPSPQLVTLNTVRDFAELIRHSKALTPSGPKALSLRSTSCKSFGSKASAINFRDFGSSERSLATKILLKSIALKDLQVARVFATHSQASKPYEFPPKVILMTLER